MKVTFSETKGKREFSYNVEYDLPVGSWDSRNVPVQLVSELENVALSHNCPSFVLDPNGDLKVTVE